LIKLCPSFCSSKHPPINYCLVHKNGDKFVHKALDVYLHSEAALQTATIFCK
jgi:hypothetical protein